MINHLLEFIIKISIIDLFLNKKDDKSQKSIKLESLNESLEINEKSFSSNKSFSSKSSQLSRSISPITRKVLNNTENEEENFDFNVNEPKKTKNVKFELDNMLKLNYNGYLCFRLQKIKIYVLQT